MNLLNIPDNHIILKKDSEITYDFNLTEITLNNQVKYIADGEESFWMDFNDNLIKRCQFENLNRCFLKNHFRKELEIRTILENGKNLLDDGKYLKAISLFDKVIYYDLEYAEALFFKSKALFGQEHYVKSLRYYKRAVKSDSSFKDIEYHRLLLKKSSHERDNFPKIKMNIYAGDEYFSKGDFINAVECYNKALLNPTNFKRKILSKLLNKKATALVKLGRISDAIDVFDKSVSVKENDYAYFHLGVYKDIEYLKKASDITKKQLLVKASKLYESGENVLSLECLEYFFKNHYKVDYDYKTALKLKYDVLNALNKDISKIDLICEGLKINL